MEASSNAHNIPVRLRELRQPIEVLSSDAFWEMWIPVSQQQRDQQ